MRKKLLLGSLCVLTGLGAVKLDTDKTPAYDSIAQAEITASSPQITLLNPGNEPKQELRFTPKVASKTISKMTMNTEIIVLVDGQNIPPKNISTATINMEVKVTNVAENGDINADFAYTDVEVIAEQNTPPEILSAIEEQMNQLVGSNGSFLLDNRGNTKDIKIAFPDNIDLKMLVVNSLKNLSSPLPTEAVGIGAQWQFIDSQITMIGINDNGIKMNQIATYELVDIQDNIATLNVKIEQQAEEQPINDPNVPPGANLSITYTGVGNGKMTINLAQIMPLEATIKINSETLLKSSGSEKESTIMMQLNNTTNLQSKYE